MSILKGKTAIVTGAGAGIGRAIAKKLAAMGADVAATDLNLEIAKETVELLENPTGGQKHRSYKIDVIDREMTRNVFKQINEDYGHIDILINNAGVSTMKKFEDLTDKDWDFNLDVNLKGMFYGLQEILPYMKDNGGKICNTCSMAALKCGTYETHYAASKWGVAGLTKNVAVEYAPYKINVNCVCPGFVKTSMQDREIVWEGKLRGITPEEVIQGYINATPLRRLCYPEDVAKGVGFLVSPEADFITGIMLDISGGAAIV